MATIAVLHERSDSERERKSDLLYYVTNEKKYVLRGNTSFRVSVIIVYYVCGRKICKTTITTSIICTIQSSIREVSTEESLSPFSRNIQMSKKIGRGLEGG